MTITYQRHKQPNYLTLNLNLVLNKYTPGFIVSFFKELSSKDLDKVVNTGLIALLSGILTEEELRILASMFMSLENIEGAESKVKFTETSDGFRIYIVCHARKGRPNNLFKFISFLIPYLCMVGDEESTMKPIEGNDCCIGVIIAPYEDVLSTIYYSKETGKILLDNIGLNYLSVEISASGLKKVKYPVHTEIMDFSRDLQEVNEIFKVIKDEILKEEKVQMGILEEEKRKERERLDEIFENPNPGDVTDVEMREIREVDEGVITNVVKEHDSHLEFAPLTETIHLDDDDDLDQDHSLEEIYAIYPEWVNKLLYVSFNGYSLSHKDTFMDLAEKFLNEGYLAKAYVQRDIKLLLTEKGHDLIKKAIAYEIDLLKSKILSKDFDKISTLSQIKSLIDNVNEDLKQI